MIKTIKTKRRDGTTTRLIKTVMESKNSILIVPNSMLMRCVIDRTKKMYPNTAKSLTAITTIQEVLSSNINEFRNIKFYIDEGVDSLDMHNLNVHCGKCNSEIVEWVIGEYNLNKWDWNMEYTCQWSNEPNTPKIKNIVYDIENGTTVVFFKDGTKEIARVMEGDTFNKEVGVMQCLVKKMYGSRSGWKKIVNSGVEKKSKKTKKVDYLKDFLEGKICIKCSTEEDRTTLLQFLDTTKVRWYGGKKPSEFIFRTHSIIAYVGLDIETDSCLCWDDQEESFTECGVKVVNFASFMANVRNKA